MEDHIQDILAALQSYKNDKGEIEISEAHLSAILIITYLKGEKSAFAEADAIVKSTFQSKN